MKRLIASVIVVVAFTFYAIFARNASTTQTAVVAGTDSTGTTTSPVTIPPVFTSDDDDDEGVVATQPQTVVTTAPSSGSGVYANGTYTGAQADALYGMVQVQVVVQGGRITDVQFLSYPTGHNSDRINAQAMPILTQEAISAQSASVQVVSGATLTSKAFMQSLQSALSQA